MLYWATIPVRLQSGRSSSWKEHELQTPVCLTLIALSLFLAAVSYGPPLGIGNTLLRTDRLSIDAYENHRRERRPSDDLRVPRLEREHKLMKAGYSRSEILQVTLKMDRIRIRRQVSARGGPIQQVRDLVLRRRKQRARAQKIVKE